MKRSVVVMWAVGLVAGGVLGQVLPEQFPLFPPQRFPLPHQVAKYPGGISLRFAMVHDVIHERFAKHGAEYYKARNHAVRAQLDRLDAASPSTTRPAEAVWGLMDDLAAGHIYLGEFDLAVDLMRNKLGRQERLGIAGAALYSTYANLGTSMMIDALVKAGGGKDASAELSESLTWVRKSIEVNPQAHFGREVWQVVLGEYLLDAQRDPKLLLEFDMIGNSLKENHVGSSPIGAVQFFSRRRYDLILELSLGDRADARERIRTVGADDGWDTRTHTSHKTPVPFDEPVLGIVGMWRYGAGANPHFALALAETMSRVGQHHIAWSAYERAARLAKGKLADYCRMRQEKIERKVSDGSASLTAAFDAELKAGLDYQAAYQAYEAARIAAGTSIDDPHFYDDFLARHGEISSDPQHADEIAQLRTGVVSNGLAPALLGGGLFAFLTSLRSRRKRAGTPAAAASVA